MLNGERITKIVLFLTSLIIIFIASGMVLTLMEGAIPAFKEFGFKFIISSDWNPTDGRESYGALPFIIGTIATSIIALLICLPLAFSTSLFIGEIYRGTKLASFIGMMVDMLAGIPSIVYGLWGFYVLRPWVVDMGFNDQGYGVFTAGLILAIMVIPYATSISVEMIKMVQNDLKEAAYSLGATRKDVIFSVILPNARSGIFTSYILAFGRAVGETMAVTMLIGNSNIIPKGLFDTGNTMASLIANQFGEADGLKLSSLVAIALLLFFITGLINGFGKLLIKKL
ncbi:MAG TPA: phosphate ABC transporter permease subunit PstC [Flavobacteriaceae bacterium]|nr:phosphate ABC transporter permease subunit PstC [Flavobacteriaceae bacterium]HEX5742967.1 phosphate ABC transporter permease subunit PstC [Flavobacteriaceae bacterium]